MSIPSAHLIAAHDAGYDACMENEPATKNPHDDGTDAFRAWEAGYLQGLDARQSMREAGFA